MRNLIAAALCLVLCAAEAVAGEVLTGTRMHRSPEHTRVVFDLTGPLRYKIHTVAAHGDKPHRLVIDLYGGKLASRAALEVDNLATTPVEHIRSGVHDGYLRVVLDLAGQFAHRDFTLPPVAPYGDRIVIDLMEPGPPAGPVQSPPPRPGLRDVVVVVDAGHGGVDPGAVGAGGILEKDVAFAIAREMAAAVSAVKGFKGVLTRTGDYYLPLRKRTRLARETHGADLFVSIHADAFRTAAARGASVYALSRGGASSETARWLAQKENQSDLVGGVSLEDYDEPVRKVLLDLSMDQTLADSLAVGEAVLGELEAIARLHSRRVEQAEFAVLKSPDVPSILVESGYLSNAVEARRLASADYQKRLAAALARGVRKWLERNPPPGTYLAAEREARATTAHVIRRGEILPGGAARLTIPAAEPAPRNTLAGERLVAGGKTGLAAR